MVKKAVSRFAAPERLNVSRTAQTQVPEARLVPEERLARAVRLVSEARLARAVRLVSEARLAQVAMPEPEARLVKAERLV